MRRKDSGFTIIELLVVVIIIGIIAAIAIPAYLNHRNKAFDAVLRADLKNYANAITEYRVLHGEMPTDATALLEYAPKSADTYYAVYYRDGTQPVWLDTDPEFVIYGHHMKSDRRAAYTTFKDNQFPRGSFGSQAKVRSPNGSPYLGHVDATSGTWRSFGW